MNSKAVTGPIARAGRSATWMIPPAAGWQRKAGRVLSGRLAVPLYGLAGVVLSLGAVAFWAPPHQAAAGLALAAIALALVVWLIAAIQRDLYAPLSYLRHWALRMRDGNLNSRIPVPKHGEFAELSRDINSLSETLQTLSHDMEDQVRRQTERIEQKTLSLQVLYQVAASINASKNLDDLLARFLRILTEVTNARAGTVRLLTDDDQMRLVASTGLDDDFLVEERLVPMNRCFCGRAITQGATLCNGQVRSCEKFLSRPLFDAADVEVIAVPLEYRGRKLGVYNLFVDRPGIMGREDLQELLTSIGQHLGMAIEKARLDNEARRLSIIEERTLLAHELHDSLAQTLASLRFQVSTVEDCLRDYPGVSRTELRRLRSGVEEAHFELRELMTHFRAPMDERGLIPSVEGVIAKFRKTTGISVFLQNEWQHSDLPANLELQLLRILQEALCNIRKHSQAHAVRIRLRHRPEHDYQIMVEDDGIGIPPAPNACDTDAGEHIGLSVMRERAGRMGGTLRVESEPGEGTRLLLSFRYPPQSQVSPSEKLQSIL